MLFRSKIRQTAFMMIWTPAGVGGLVDQQRPICNDPIGSAEKIPDERPVYILSRPVRQSLISVLDRMEICMKLRSELESVARIPEHPATNDRHKKTHRASQDAQCSGSIELRSGYRVLPFKRTGTSGTFYPALAPSVAQLYARMTIHIDW